MSACNRFGIEAGDKWATVGGGMAEIFCKHPHIESYVGEFSLNENSDDEEPYAEYDTWNRDGRSEAQQEHDLTFLKSRSGKPVPQPGDWCTGEEWVAMGGDKHEFCESWIANHDDDTVARYLCCGLHGWHCLHDYDPSCMCNLSLYSIRLTSKQDLLVPLPNCLASGCADGRALMNYFSSRDATEEKIRTLSADCAASPFTGGCELAKMLRAVCAENQAMREALRAILDNYNRATFVKLAARDALVGIED